MSQPFTRSPGVRRSGSQGSHDSRFSHLVAHDFINKRRDYGPELAVKMLIMMLTAYLVFVMISFVAVLTVAIKNMPSGIFRSRKWVSAHKQELLQYYHPNEDGTMSDSIEQDLRDELGFYFEYWYEAMTETALLVAMKYSVLTLVALLGILFAIKNSIYGLYAFTVLLILANIGFELILPLTCGDKCSSEVKEKRTWQKIILGFRVFSSVLICIQTLSAIVEIKEENERVKSLNANLKQLERTPSGRLQLPSRRMNSPTAPTSPTSSSSSPPAASNTTTARPITTTPKTIPPTATAQADVHVPAASPPIPIVKRSGSHTNVKLSGSGSDTSGSYHTPPESPNK